MKILLICIIQWRNSTRKRDCMANGKQKIWVSDLIGDDFKRWNNEFVILDCGTACGKTYFCINRLGKYAANKKKKLLYLCNRSKLRSQTYWQVRNLNLQATIYVTSYQALQKKIQQGDTIPHYDYIIADECHYFTTDAGFNDYTDVAYNYVMKQKESVVVFVSATAKKFFKYLQDTNKVKKKNSYRLDKDYSYVTKLFYYQGDELHGIIDDILGNEVDSKIIVFCNSGNRIIDMSKIYGDKADYYCSKNAKDKRLRTLCGWKENEQGKVIEEPACIKVYADDLITFDKRILFTTSVLDNGVDLKDRRIKHVFSEIIDVDTMIQSLGRKRSLDKDDNCYFYIRLYQKKGIQGFINNISDQLEPVNLYKNNYSEFYQQYGNGKNRSKISRNKIFYNLFRKKNNYGKIKVNECKYRKYNQDYDMFTLMKELGHKGYLECILESSLTENAEDVVCNVEQLDCFIQFLKSIEGKRLYTDDQQCIKEEFETIGLKLRYKGINTFNGALDDVYKDLYKCRFYKEDIDGKSYVDKRRKLDNGLENPNRDKRYWILEDRTGSEKYELT